MRISAPRWPSAAPPSPDESVITYLAEKGYSAAYGARNLQRLIQKDVEDAIATEIIDHLKGAAKTVGLTVQDGKIVVLAV